MSGAVKRAGSLMKKLEYVAASSIRPRPSFRVIDGNGRIDKTGRKYENVMPPETRKEVYKTMVKTSIMDDIFYLAQRQGRISFYMTCSGNYKRVVLPSPSLNVLTRFYNDFDRRGSFCSRLSSCFEPKRRSFRSVPRARPVPMERFRIR